MSSPWATIHTKYVNYYLGKKVHACTPRMWEDENTGLTWVRYQHRVYLKILSQGTNEKKSTHSWRKMMWDSAGIIAEVLCADSLELSKVLFHLCILACQGLVKCDTYICISMVTLLISSVINFYSLQGARFQHIDIWNLTETASIHQIVRDIDEETHLHEKNHLKNFWLKLNVDAVDSKSPPCNSDTLEMHKTWKQVTAYTWNDNNRRECSLNSHHGWPSVRWKCHRTKESNLLSLSAIHP